MDTCFQRHRSNEMARPSRQTWRQLKVTRTSTATSYVIGGFKGVEEAMAPKWQKWHAALLHQHHTSLANSNANMHKWLPHQKTANHSWSQQQIWIICIKTECLALIVYLLLRFTKRDRVKTSQWPVDMLVYYALSASTSNTVVDVLSRKAAA